MTNFKSCESKISLVILMLSFSFGFESRAGDFLELKTVLSSVEQAYPIILAVKEEQRRAEGEYLSSLGGFDPTLKGSATNTSGYFQNTTVDFSLEQATPLWGTKLYAGWKTGQGTFQPLDARLPTFNNGQVRAGLEVPILRGGSIDERRTRVNSTEQGFQSASQATQSQELEIMRQASQRYWDWVAAGNKVFVSQEMLRIAKERDDAIRIRIRNGDTAKIDQKDNHRQVLQRKAALISAERGFQKAALELGLYYRDREGQPVFPELRQVPNPVRRGDCGKVLSKFEKEKSSSPLSSNVSMSHSSANSLSLPSDSLKTHPALRQIDFQIKALEFEKSLAKNEVLPKLNFQFEVSRQLGINPGSGFLPPSDTPGEYRAGLNLEIPILFRSSRGKLTSASANLIRLETLQRFAHDKLSNQAVDAIQSMKAANERLELVGEEIELSKSLEESERVRAEEGDSNLLLVNLRELTTRDALFKEIDAYTDFFKALADYEAAVGGAWDGSNGAGDVTQVGSGS